MLMRGTPIVSLPGSFASLRPPLEPATASYVTQRRIMGPAIPTDKVSFTTQQRRFDTQTISNRSRR